MFGAEEAGLGDLPVAFDGWATALVIGALFTIAVTVVLSKVERHRSVKVALAAASQDIYRNVQWLGYVDWQRRHPDQWPRDLQFGSFDLFPHYAPVLMAERPKLAGYLLRFHMWVEYARTSGDTSPGFVLSEDPLIEIDYLAKQLRDGYGFDWTSIYGDILENFQWAKRDFSIS